MFPEDLQQTLKMPLEGLQLEHRNLDSTASDTTKIKGKNMQLQIQTVSSSERKTNKIAKKVLQNVLQNTKFTNIIFTFNTLSKYVYKYNLFYNHKKTTAFLALIFIKPTNAQHWGREGHTFLVNVN